MSKEDGFLKPDVASSIAEIRRDFLPWFELAESTNRLAMAILPELNASTQDNRQLLGVVLYARAIQSFQALLLLAERGLIADARTILRSCAETAILQRKVAADADFAELLIQRHFYHHRSLRNAWLNDQDAKTQMTPEEIESVRASVVEINDLYPNSPPSDINLADVAKSVDGSALYNAIYRPASGDAAHATLDALCRHIRSDDKGNILGLIFGPDTRDLPETMFDALSVCFHVLDAAIENFSLTNSSKALADCMVRWKALAAQSDGLAETAQPAVRDSARGFT